MLRHPPTFNYCGLTIILSNPARNDRKMLIDSGTTAGWFFENQCLAAYFSRYQCDIRQADDNSSLLPNTKCVLLLGQYAHSKFTNVPTTLDENRGSPILVQRGGKDIATVSSFTPQDAIDPVELESKHNAEYKDIDDLDEDSDESAVGELLESKGRGRTARANYRFWLMQDVAKAAKIVDKDGIIPRAVQPKYHIYPSAQEVISTLLSTQKEDFYFDMETDFISADMRCFAFMFGNRPTDVWIVPVLTTDYKPAYDQINEILRALAVCIRRNTTVAHNGAHFDFLILAIKYRIPISKVYDTMVAMNRIYPTLEKSLGHCVSLETFEPYHKNEGIHGYRNATQAEQLYYYCGKDVFTMYLVKQAQIARAHADSGLGASIALANRSIKPYLTNTILGLHFSEEERQAWIRKSDKLLTAYMRFMRVLHGENVAPLISNQKCTKYFHEQLGYSVVKRSEKTGNPSLAEDALIKLALMNDNPVIRFLIKYRQKQKETSTLKFKVWRQQQQQNV